MYEGFLGEPDPPQFPSIRDSPVQSQLPVSWSGHRHPVELPDIVGGVHPTKHHHAALWVFAEGGVREEKFIVGRKTGA